MTVFVPPLPLSTFTLLVGVPVNSRVSTKIQQLLNTLKRPKRPPLCEFFTDDSEEIVEGEFYLKPFNCIIPNVSRGIF